MVRDFARFGVVLGAALIAAGCGGAGATAKDAGDDAPAGGDAQADGAGDADEDGSGLPPLVPPQGDCGPYLGKSSCTIHVTPNGTPGGDGLRWATALSDVQDALDRATCGPCDVWVASGTYLPPRGPDAADPDPRNRSFMLWPHVRLLGGFAGTEPTLSHRSATTPPTILSGDLGDPGNASIDNAYHVVVAGDDTRMDGVTIRDGFANGFNVGQGFGAGVFLAEGAIELVNVTISDNVAGSGAGIWSNGSIKLQGCTLARNVADVGGGLSSSGIDTLVIDTVFAENVGVFVGGGLAFQGRALTVLDSTFLRNRGDFGASMALSKGGSQIERVWFEGNVAGLFGGALFLRLGARGRLSNSVAVANSSVGHGGAITVWTASLDVDSSTIVDNSATYGGGVLVKDGAHLSLTDSVLWRNADDLGKTFFLEGENNDVTITNTVRPDEVAGTGGVAADPRLGNVPLATRFAESKNDAADQMTLAQADQHFAAGDRIELGDDGLERRVTAVAAGFIKFSPARTTPTPRWLRVDRWAADAPSLKLDLTPTAASPLIDAAGPGAPAVDVTGRPRTGKADIGAVER